MKHVIKVDTRPKNISYAEWETLGFDKVKQKFLLIFEALQAPITVGLYGEWGSGKTRMIEALKEDLDRQHFCTIVFDTWRYRTEQNLILPILSCIDKELPARQKNLKSFKKIMSSAALAVGSSYIKNNIGIDFKDVKEVMSEYETNYEYYKKYIDVIDKLQVEFQQVVSGRLKIQSKKNLIIFIDNLDRCLPDTVINLIEDISGLFNIENSPCIFVLAIDKHSVIHAIKTRFKGVDGSKYLEKIVQVALKMPTPFDDGDSAGKSGAYHFMKRYEKALGFTKASVEGDERHQIYNSLKPLSKIFSKGFLANPRRIERIINKLCLLDKVGIFKLNKSHADIPIILFLLVLNEYFPKVLDSIETDADFTCLGNCLEWSRSRDYLPSNVEQLKNIRFSNEALNTEYTGNPDFYEILKYFKSFIKVSEFPIHAKRIFPFTQLID